MRRTITLGAALLATSLTLAGCGGSEPAEEDAGGATTTDDAGASPEALQVGLAYDIGGRGDQSFNDAAAAGLDRSVEALGVDAQEVEAAAGESDAAKAERLRQLAEAGYDPILAVGFAYSAPLAEVAPDYPDTRFAIIDDANATGDNIANLTFAEEEGSFLVGAAAGLKTETDNVGFIGGVEVPLIEKFEAGFRAGVEAANPEATVQTTYLTQPPDFGGFGDPARALTAAQGMIDSGADIIYHAAGGSGSGVFEAVDAAGELAIGVDSDQALTAPEELRDVILTSMLKRVDVAVEDFITSVAEGKFTPGVTVYDLEADGVGYATTGGMVDDIVPQLEDYEQQIVSGEIEVPETVEG